MSSMPECFRTGDAFRAIRKSPGSVEFETRSGNLDRPQKNWSAWANLNAGRIASPPARFLQYRVKLSVANGLSPEVTEVEAAYQMKNVAPVIDDLEITPANYKFPAPPAPAVANQTPQFAAAGTPEPHAAVHAFGRFRNLTRAYLFEGAIGSPVARQR